MFNSSNLKASFSISTLRAKLTIRLKMNENDVIKLSQTQEKYDIGKKYFFQKIYYIIWNRLR